LFDVVGRAWDIFGVQVRLDGFSHHCVGAFYHSQPIVCFSWRNNDFDSETIGPIAESLAAEGASFVHEESAWRSEETDPSSLKSSNGFGSVLRFYDSAHLVS
jgi:hypothetical protein